MTTIQFSRLSSNADCLLIFHSFVVSRCVIGLRIVHTWCKEYKTAFITFNGTSSMFMLAISDYLLCTSRHLYTSRNLFVVVVVPFSSHFSFVWMEYALRVKQWMSQKYLAFFLFKKQNTKWTLRCEFKKKKSKLGKLSHVRIINWKKKKKPSMT